MSICSRCLALHIQMRLSNIVVSFYLTGILIARASILSNSNLHVNARKVSRAVCLRYVSIDSLCAIVHCIGARYSIATILHINGHCIRHMLILSLNLFHANHRKIVWQLSMRRMRKTTSISINDFLQRTKEFTRIYLPHATFAFGSCFKWASKTASLIWSHILSKSRSEKKIKTIIFGLFGVQYCYTFN